MEKDDFCDKVKQTANTIGILASIVGGIFTILKGPSNGPIDTKKRK